MWLRADRQFPAAEALVSQLHREQFSRVEENPVNIRVIDWIWHIRGRLALAPGHTGNEAFDRLDPLFRQAGTSHERTDDALSFMKKNSAAQDKMSVFDRGAFRIESGVKGPVLHYHLTSRALLFCFLAPLLFISIAQFTVVTNKWNKAHQESPEKPVVAPMHPIDRALGAPVPDTPDADGSGAEGDAKKPSPTPAYVFAGIFAALYVAGRILEHRLVKALFRKRLLAV